jgi:hypothetical protein
MGLFLFCCKFDYMDLLTASSAKCMNLSIVANSTYDFSRIDVLLLDKWRQ